MDNRRTGYRTTRRNRPRRQEPNEITEMWRDVRRDSQERRARRLPNRQQEITALRQQGYEVQELTPWHFRINGILDLYPANKRYHNLRTGRRGDYHRAVPFAKSVVDGFRGIDMATRREVKAWVVRCTTCGKVVAEGTGTPPALGSQPYDELTEVGRALKRHLLESVTDLHDYVTVAKLQVTED